ncbi:Proteasome subunit alpha type-3, partial [Trichinella sp. T6]
LSKEMGSNSNSGYDLSAATFSPDGRIYQLEYANKAVNNSHTCVAIRGLDGVVFGVEKAVSSSLYEDYSNQRIATVADKIGFVFSGLYPDGRALHHYAVEEAISYHKSYRSDIPCGHLAERLSLYVHAYTLYGALRPFGCSVFLGSWSPLKGPELYLVEPCGSMFGYRSWAIGRSHQAAKAEVDEMNSTTKPVSELINEAARIIYSIRDEARDKHCIMELSWVSEATGGKHELVPENIYKEAEEFAKRALEESDDEDDDTKISDLIVDVNKKLDCTEKEKSCLACEQKKVLFDLNKLLKKSIALSNKVREKRLELENVRCMRRIYESKKQSCNYCKQFEKSTLKLRDADSVDISKSNIGKLKQPNCSEERKAEIHCMLSELDNQNRQLLFYRQLLTEQEKSVEQERRFYWGSFDSTLWTTPTHEYFNRNVNNAKACVAIRGSDGVVFGIQTTMPCSIYPNYAGERIATVADKIGFVFSGSYSDGEAMQKYVIEEAKSYYDSHQRDVPCFHLAESLANYVHEFKYQGVLKPFDCRMCLGTWSPITGPEIYAVQPTATQPYKSWIHGCNDPPDNAEMSKSSFDRIPVRQLVKEAALFLYMVRNAINDARCIMKLSWVSEDTGGKHEFVPENVFQEAVEFATNDLPRILPSGTLSDM